MRFDQCEFRRVLSHYPTGVCVITAAGAHAAPVGLAVGSFTSASLDPPLIAFFPSKRSLSWPLIAESGKFCVNVLASHQLAICKQFSMSGIDKFASVSHRLSMTGSPILDDVVAWIDCIIDAVHEAGDHLIVLGKVVGLKVESQNQPLLVFQGKYGLFDGFS